MARRMHKCGRKRRFGGIFFIVEYQVFLKAKMHTCVRSVLHL